jgi:hypothetical protein
MGSTGMSAVNAPILPLPYPTAAVSSRLANVQFSESMPWLYGISHAVVALGWASRTQTALQAGSTCRCDAPACRLRCPLWSTFMAVSELVRKAAGRTHIHMPNAKL